MAPAARPASSAQLLPGCGGAQGLDEREPSFAQMARTRSGRTTRPGRGARRTRLTGFRGWSPTRHALQLRKEARRDRRPGRRNHALGRSFEAFGTLRRRPVPRLSGRVIGAGIHVILGAGRHPRCTGRQDEAGRLPDVVGVERAATGMGRGEARDAQGKERCAQGCDTEMGGRRA